MPRHLLQVARTLNAHGQRLTLPSRQQAYLRRSASSAYYAVFHLLADEAANLLSASHAVHLRRGLDHTPMKEASEAFYPGTTAPAGGPGTTFNLTPRNLGPLVVPWELAVVAWNFVWLQGMRHTADYNYTQPVTAGNATTAFARAEEAFQLWDQVRTTPVARVYLGAITTWATLRRR